MAHSRKLFPLTAVSAFILSLSPLTTAAIAAAATTTTTATPSSSAPVFRSGDSPLTGEKRYVIRYVDNEKDEDED